MKKFVNFLSVGLLLVIMYTVVPAAYAVEEPPSGNHRKDCFLWIEGCKHKVDKSCFGGNCHEDPH